MNTFTDAQVLHIARHQKAILWLLGLSILLIIGGPLVPATSVAQWLYSAALITVGIIGAVLIYRLARVLDEWPWLYAVCAFIPYVNLVTLLIINLRATAALERRGILVGLLGADRVELQRLAAAVKAADERQPVVAPMPHPPHAASENIAPMLSPDEALVLLGCLSRFRANSADFSLTHNAEYAALMRLLAQLEAELSKRSRPNSPDELRAAQDRVAAGADQDTPCGRSG